MMTHSALTIPRLKDAAPHHEFRKAVGGNRLARLALILHELGVLRDDDAPRPRQANEATLIERALTRWTATRLGGALRVLTPAYLVVRPDTVDEYVEMVRYGSNDEREEDIDVEHSVVFALCAESSAEVYTLQRRCAPLRTAAPALVETALNVLEFGHWRSIVCLTPESVREMAERMYGWDDYMDDGEERSLTPEVFDAIVPPWTSRPKRRLTRPQLEKLARQRAPKIADIARAVLDLLDAIGDKKAISPNILGYWHTCFGAVIRWSEKDPTLQIGDDYVNDAYNGGESTDDFTMHAVKLEKAAVARFLDGFGRMLTTIARTDRLIALLAEQA